MAKVKVLGKNWIVQVKSEKSLQKSYPDCHAIALLDDRKIIVRRTSLNYITIAHELTHAWLYEMSYYELDLDDHQIEEFFCELVAKYSEQIIKDAKDLCQKLS